MSGKPAIVRGRPGSTKETIRPGTVDSHPLTATAVRRWHKGHLRTTEGYVTAAEDRPETVESTKMDVTHSRGTGKTVYMYFSPVAAPHVAVTQ